MCNGRVIINANEQLTGWGCEGRSPLFMPKNRGFFGIVFLRSYEPEELPWDTTKRGINSESPVYIRTLKKMMAAARLVIERQNKMYESSDNDDPSEEYRESVKELQGMSATVLAAERSATYRVNDTVLFFQPAKGKTQTN